MSGAQHKATKVSEKDITDGAAGHLCTKLLYADLPLICNDAGQTYAASIALFQQVAEEENFDP